MGILETKIQLSQVESSLCTSPQDKVDKELDGQEEIGFSFGWNSVYINICIQSLPNANSYVYIYIYITICIKNYTSVDPKQM